MPFHKKIKEKIKKFFAPAPSVRTRDVLREIPSAFWEVVKLREREKKVVKFGVGVAQEAARNIASIPLAAVREPLGAEDLPEGLQKKVTTAFFGKERTQPVTQRFQGLQKKLPGPLGKAAVFPAAIGLAAIDFGTLGGRKTATELLVKAGRNLPTIVSTLKKLGVADDVAKAFAPRFNKITGAFLSNRAKKAAPIVDELIKIQGEAKPVTKGVVAPAEKLTEAIRKAKPAQLEQQALQSAERARRVARVVAVGEKVGGERGFFAQLGQLKGPLPKASFEAIRKQFTQPEVDSLFNVIQDAPALLPLEKVTAKGALGKLLEGSTITRGEIDLLKEVFPRTLVDAILKKRPASAKIWEALGKAINLPRAVMATVDLSAPLRQGAFLIGRPGQFLPSFRDMFKFAASEKAYEGFIEATKAKPIYREMKQARLALTDLGGGMTTREEAFMSNWAEKIPGFGILAKASNRAYSGFLNKLRVDTFEDIVTKSRVAGKKLNEKELKDIGSFINAATGRGNLPNVLADAAPALNAALFSPRLMASRLTLLNPLFYVTLSPVARKEALRSLFSFSAIAGSVLGLAGLVPGVEIGKDPRSADFGKIKVGNTRYDILGGFQQYLRLSGQIISGERISTTTGRTITLGEGYGVPTRLDILQSFFETKTSPLASLVLGLIKGETVTGENVDLPTEVVNRFIPMVIQDLYDLSIERGAEGFMMGLPAVFGVGVQTYGKQELVFGESKIGEPTAQVRPVQGMAEKIRQLVLGQLPLGSTKGFSVEAYFNQLSNLKREEARDIWDKINEANPELAEKISKVVTEREKGITPKDKDLKDKEVASGDRAQAVLEQLNKLETKEEKRILWDEYVEKGIITDKVGEQLLFLLKKQP